MIWSLVLLLVVGATFVHAQEWNCETPECEGHKAGYDWAMNRVVTEPDCDVAGEHTNSPSFAEGCKTAVRFKHEFEAARELFTTILQAYNFGKQVAKDSRALPIDCDEAYQNLVASWGDTSLLTTPFRTGCLEVAQKQAKRIIKENEKAVKEAKKNAQGAAH